MEVIDQLPALLACVERAEQARECRRLEELDQAARRLYDRLLRRWSSVNPGRARTLKGITHHVLLEREGLRSFSVSVLLEENTLHETVLVHRSP